MYICITIDSLVASSLLDIGIYNILVLFSHPWYPHCLYVRTYTAVCGLQVEDVKLVIPMPSCVTNVNPISTCKPTQCSAHCVKSGDESCEAYFVLCRWHAKLRPSGTHSHMECKAPGSIYSTIVLAFVASRSDPTDG